MRIIVTGATGTIGMSLLSKLTRNNYDVTVIANKDSSRNERLSIFENITIVEASLSDYSSIELEGKYDIFIHMAWNGGKNRNNVEANFNSAIASSVAVELAAKYNCQIFLSTGSQAEYGIKFEQIFEGTECEPDTPFGVAKLSSMWLTRNECKKHNIRHIWLRVFSVYGPYDGEQTMIMQTIRNVLNDDIPRFTSGNQLWDFIHSDDIADAIVKLILNKRCSGIYLIGSGNKLRLKDYLEMISNQLNFNLEQSIGKYAVVSSNERNLWVNCNRLQNDTGWNPKIKFSDGIRMLINFVKSR